MQCSKFQELRPYQCTGIRTVPGSPQAKLEDNTPFPPKSSLFYCNSHFKAIWEVKLGTPRKATVAYSHRLATALLYRVHPTTCNTPSPCKKCAYSLNSGRLGLKGTAPEVCYILWFGKSLQTGTEGDSGPNKLRRWPPSRFCFSPLQLIGNQFI